jgi:Xaa-Pro aminopeptidase
VTKRPEELALMAAAGRLLASVFGHLDRVDLVGKSTLQVNDLVDAFIVDELQARPASKGQYGYAYALNASRNHVVCHGVPSATEILQSGDIVNFDITLEKHGYIADSSKTYLVGEVAPAARRLVQVTHEASGRCARAPGSATSATPSSATRAATATRSSASTAATESGARCTSRRRCCTGAGRRPAWSCAKAWCSRSSRC